MSSPRPRPEEIGGMGIGLESQKEFRVVVYKYYSIRHRTKIDAADDSHRCPHTKNDATDDSYRCPRTKNDAADDSHRCPRTKNTSRLPRIGYCERREPSRQLWFGMPGSQLRPTTPPPPPTHRRLSPIKPLRKRQCRHHITCPLCSRSHIMVMLQLLLQQRWCLGRYLCPARKPQDGCRPRARASRRMSPITMRPPCIRQHQRRLNIVYPLCLASLDMVLPQLLLQLRRCSLRPARKPPRRHLAPAYRLYLQVLKDFLGRIQHRVHRTICLR